MWGAAAAEDHCATIDYFVLAVENQRGGYAHGLVVGRVVDRYLVLAGFVAVRAGQLEGKARARFHLAASFIHEADVYAFDDRLAVLERHFVFDDLVAVDFVALVVDLRLELELHPHVRHVWRVRQVNRDFELPSFVVTLFERLALPFHATRRASDAADD